jgi:hypothetical protein
MKRLNTSPRAIAQTSQTIALFQQAHKAFATAIVFCVLFTGAQLRAQTPVNQLHFQLSDAPGSTTSPSDTSLNPSAIVTAITMYNAAGTAFDLHGALGTGLTNNLGALGFARAMDFTTNIIATQTNQPANSTVTDSAQGTSAVAADLNDANLTGLGNGGTIGSFVATIWFKQPKMMPTGANIGPRLWILNSGATGVDSGAANSMGLKFQANNQLAFQFGTDNPTFQPALPAPYPTNKWIFVAIVYDNTNFYMYLGSDTETAQLIGTASSPNRSFAISGAGCLALGNRRSGTTNTRGLNGWINDFRFYNGWGGAAFVESVRTSALGSVPAISSIYPDGNTLMQGTNVLTFNVASSNSTINSIKLVLNGVDVSAGVVTTGPANSLSCSYTGLAKDQTANTAIITAVDATGLSTTASATFDTFSATNFVVEAEEFDFNSGLFIDNPTYTDGNPADANSYFGLDSTEGIDTHKGGAAGTGTAVYRAGLGIATKTQTGVATGEQSWPKFFNLLDGSGTPIVGHIVGNWSSGEWQNYTKTFPNGQYNVYGRLSAGTASTITFSKVTSGQGTSSQTTSNLGTFSFTDTSFNLYKWVPLLDGQGNLAILNLSGVNTLRATSGGGGNADFYMFVPANTSLPVIHSVYPTGQFLFEPTNSFQFTVNSPITTISTNNVMLTINGSNVTSKLVFTGGPSTWNVSYSPLLTNQSYTAVIRVVDALGNPSQSTLNLDTWDPVFQVEAEAFDFDPNQSPIAGTGARYIDNSINTAPGVPNASSYEGQVGIQGIDEFGVSATGHADYRPNDPVATTPVIDAARRQFTGGALDYNVGFLGPNFWQQYTKTWPSGTYNLYARVASGANIGNIHETWQQVIAGWGTAGQITRDVGTFTIPTAGGYSSYIYVPLVDRFGNLAQLTLGGTNTFRALELTDPGSFGLNINFYMLTAPQTNAPRVDNVYPDGVTLMQQTNTLSFLASSPFGISNIVVTLNGSNVSSQLILTGPATSRNVSYSGLVANKAYAAVISIVDSNSQSHVTTVNFDTFNPNNFTWEAEDYDFDPTQSQISNGTGNRYIDNPVPTAGFAANSYFGQKGDDATPIDFSPIFALTHPGTYTYRPDDISSGAAAGDGARPIFLNAQLANLDPNIQDRRVNVWPSNAWVNFTRTFPSGNFYLYARLAGGSGTFNLQSAVVTGGWGTGSQTTTNLGNFVGTGGSFNTWQYVPLINTNTGLPIAISLGGTNTFQMTSDGNADANFFMLVPVGAPSVSLSATLSGTDLLVSFPTQTGFTYTLTYKDNLNDPNWTLLSPIPGDGTSKTVTNVLTFSPQRFYRLNIQ